MKSRKPQRVTAQAGRVDARDVLMVVGSVVESLGDAAILLGGDLRCLCFSPQFATLLGIRERALAAELRSGTCFLELFERIDVEQSTLADCLERSSRVSLYDIAGKNSLGRSFTVAVSVVPVLGADRKALGIVCTLREVSSAFAELTEHAKSLSTSQRQEIALQKSVFAGRLATGLAHEFNSPLACVLANQAYLKGRIGEVMTSGLPHSAQVAELCNEVQEILGEDNRSLKRLGATIGSLQGFCLSRAPDPNDNGPPPLRIVDVMRDVRIALAGTGMDTLEVGDMANCDVSAYRAEVSIALVSLMQYLHEFDIAESARQSGQQAMQASDDSESSAGERRIHVRGKCEDSCYLIQIACDEFTVDIDDAESAFDPSLVVGTGSRVKLSLDLSVSAAHIARSGGSLQLAKSATGGRLIEVRLLLA